MVININNSRKKLRLYIPPVTLLKTNISTLTLDQSIPEGEAEIITIYGNSIKDENDIIHNFTATQLNTTLGVVELPTTTYFPNGMNSIGDYVDEINGIKVIKRIRKIEEADVTGSSAHKSRAYHTTDSGAPFEYLYALNAELTGSTTTYVSLYPQCVTTSIIEEYSGTAYKKNTHWVVNPNDSSSFILTINNNSYTYTRDSTHDVSWTTYGCPITTNDKKAPSRSHNYVFTNLNKLSVNQNWYYYNNTNESIVWHGSAQQFHIRYDSATTLKQLRNKISSGEIQIYTVLANPVETEVTNNIKFPVVSGDTISINDNNSTPLVADINFYKFKKDLVYKVNCPYPIKLVDYLKTNYGSSFMIRSGIKMDIGRGFGMKLKMIKAKKSGSGWIALMGTSWDTSKRAIFYTSGGTSNQSVGLDWKNSAGGNMLTLTPNIVHTIECKKLLNTTNTIGVYYDGVLKNSSKKYDFTFNTSTSEISFLTTSSSSEYECYLYEMFIYDETNTKIFDAIPVRVGNVGYMYDRISGLLFGNSGTGNFILGPDKQ